MSVKEILEVLLIEICEAARLKNVEIYAVGDTSWSFISRNEIADDVYAVNIAVKAEDVNKLVQELNGNSNRAIESVNNNKKMSGMYFRYVDITTTCYDLRGKNRFVYNGIHVNIWILKRNLKNYKLNKLLIISERCWECKEIDFYTQKKSTLKMRALKLLAIIIWKIIGEKRGGKLLYRRLVNGRYKKKDTYRFNMPLLKICRISNDDFNKCKIIEFKGYKIKLFNKDSKIMLKYKRKLHNITFSTIVNSDISYLQYIQVVGGADFFSNKWYRRYAELIRWREKKYLPIRKIVWNSWDELYFSYYRFNLWDYYKNQKTELLKMYHNENYEELEKNLTYYINKLSLYDKKQKGLCFDCEFLEMALTIFCLRGRKKSALNIINNIRLEHFESIGEYEIRYKNNSPLDIEECIKRKKYFKDYFGKFELQSMKSQLYSQKHFMRIRADINEQIPFECLYTKNKYVLICKIKNDKCLEEYENVHVNQTIIIEKDDVEKIFFDAEYISLAIIFNELTFNNCRQIIYDCLDKSTKENQYTDYDYANEILGKLKLQYILRMQ